MPRYWCAFSADAVAPGVVIVDAPCRDTARRAACLPGVFRLDDDPLVLVLVLELPPSEARRFDGALGRPLTLVELAILDPGMGLAEIGPDQANELELLGSAMCARERAPS